MRRAAIAALAALGLVGGGCYTAPSPAPVAIDDDSRRAAEAIDAGDYARAAALYRRALATTPDSVPLHYGLGVAMTHLEDRPEAIRQFTWVLDRGQPGTPEVDRARNWLTKVGALPRRYARPGAPSEPAENQPAMAATASVEGRAVSPGGEPVPLKRLQIYLTEHPSRFNQYRVRTDAEGRFRFASVPPGVYQLSDRVAAPGMWRLRVDARPGQVVFLDLGPSNSTTVRDDFPDAR